MGKIVFSFLFGVFISSAWWSLALMPKFKNGEQWIIPTGATIPFVIVLICFVADNWED